MIGKLRHRIVVQSRTDLPDGTGGFSSTWATYTTLWAEIKPKKAFESFEAGKVRSNTTHLVTIRYNPLITSAMRFTFKGRIFQIKGIEHIDEMNDWTLLRCEEGPPS